MAAHRMGVHWMRVHPDGSDLQHMERMQYRSAKLFQWMWSDAALCADLVAVLPPDALFLARDHPLSEQKADMEADPGRTGIRHADEWAAKVQQGRVHTPLERTLFLGINEPDSNYLQRQINDYTTAFCRRLAIHGLRSGAFSFGVGHPSTKNLRPDTLPYWGWYEQAHTAVVEGGHMVVTHEYGMPANHGWGYWGDRLRHCPWQDVTFVVGECGIDSGVSGDYPSKGWQHYGLAPETFAFWLDHYMAGLDARVHSVMPFTYDFAAPWGSFDVRPAAQALEQFAWTVAPEPPEPPVIVDPPPGPQPTDKFARSVAWLLEREGGYQNDPRDSGNWTGGAPGQGELKGTNWGISAASYPDLDIIHLTRDQAIDIYRRDYWQASGADRQPWPLCLLVFDTSVLHGVGTAQAWLQQTGADAYRVAAKRLRTYTMSQHWHAFGAGWTNRVAALLEEMAT